MIQDSGLSHDRFLGGRVALWQPRTGYRAATDPVFLAAACPAKPGERVLELGCGAGAAMLCLAKRSGAHVIGVELQPQYAQLAERNLGENAVSGAVYMGDIQALPPELRQISFDHVIANPPFYPTEASTKSQDAGRDRAHRLPSEELCAWVDAGLRRLRAGGSLTIIHRAEALPQLLSAIEGRAGDATVLPLAARPGRAAKRVILQARKSRKGPFRLLAPFVIHEGAQHRRDADDFTAGANDVLRNAAPLLMQ